MCSLFLKHIYYHLIFVYKLFFSIYFRRSPLANRDVLSRASAHKRLPKSPMPASQTLASAHKHYLC